MTDQNNPYFVQTSPNIEVNQQPQQQPPYLQQNDSYQYAVDQVGVPGYQAQQAQFQTGNLYQGPPPPQGLNPYQQGPPPQQGPVIGQPIQQGLYIQQQDQYAAQQPMGTPIVITRVLPTNLDCYYTPTQFQCINCNSQSISRVVYEPGEGTWLCCCGLCCLGGILGIIPFFVPSMQDCNHFCPVCGSKVGHRQYKPC